MKKDSKADLRSRIKKLVNCDALDRQAEVKKIAKEFNIPQATINEQLKGYQQKDKSDDSIVEEVESYPDPVDGEALLESIRSELKRYVVLPEHTDLPIALWILLTYIFELFRILPCLSVVSPEKRCGKTTLLEVVQGLSNKALMASNISAAAMFRVIEKCHPTLLIDEADTSFPNNDELRGILNSGHTRASAYVIRVNTETLEPERFNTFTPKVIAMIGLNNLPDTIQDRSVIIQLRRKLADEKTDKLSIDFERHCLEIRQKCARWAVDNGDRLEAAVAPNVNNDRASDNWTPLLTIAKTIGDDCYNETKEAMLSILEVVEDDSIGAQLLRDIKSIFIEASVDKMFSETMVDKLVAIADAPWCEFGRSKKAITQRVLANQLRRFGIKSKNIRIDETIKKGYHIESLKDAFKRYASSAPPVPSATTPHYNNINKIRQFSCATTYSAVASQKVPNWLNLYDCYDVAVKTPPPRGYTPTKLTR